MGVPKFFAFLSERYPCLSKSIDPYEVPEIDNLYLDMNGIIHVCSHPDDANPHFRITEEAIFLAIFRYLEFLFKTIKPRKLFFMAVDGVAPRAKMNQQRGRRFRTAKEIEVQEKTAIEHGEVLPTEERFDSNCITPGTVFMDRLHKQLQYFVVRKISTDPLWQECTVILSGHETPGEGEHKIMDYIRYLKSRPDWDPHTSHCLYGLDADLIMLGLCTHDPNFCLLREEVQFGRKKRTPTSVSNTKFFLLHLSLLRDYLDLEFKELKSSLPFPYDIEHIVDDWILMGFLVGNDFIPHLPNLHIHGGALPILFNVYKQVLPTLDGYINEGGYLNLPRFQTLLAHMGKLEFENFEEENGDILYMEQKTGRRLREYDEQPTTRTAELQALIDETNAALEDTDDTDLSDDEDKGTVRAEFDMHKTHYYSEKMELEANEEVLKSQAEGYVRGIQWILHYYFHGCQSWSWYYPHHYSPYVSDISNFKNMDLTFEKGTPFLPFHQLLAVLPPGSKTLLPEAYQPLMTSEDSPIADFYPPEFETDLNGKLQDYEALVLIPFINEKRLLEAMETCSDKLNDDERRRNTHGPMLAFKFTMSNLGVYKAPGLFPDIATNHATVEAVLREDIHVEPNPMLFRRHPDLDPNVYTPGFPSLRFLPHEGKLMHAKVQVFNMPSRRENMIITLKEGKSWTAKEAALKLVDKMVYVGWPHLRQAKVAAVADAECRYASGATVTEERTDLWESQVACFHRDHMSRWGVEVGNTEVLVYANVLNGQRYTVTDSMKVSVEQIWSIEKQAFPLQVVINDIKVQPLKRKTPIAPHELYPIGAAIILLEKPCYGVSGTIKDNSSVNTNGTVKVELSIKNELAIEKSQLLKLNDQYFNCGQACRMAQCSGLVFAKITGRLKGKCNTIGLDLKFNSRSQQVPGYTKKEGTVWLYSKRTVELVRKYLDAFPELQQFYHDNVNDDANDSENIDDIFGEGKGTAKMKEIKEWLKQNAPKSVGLISFNSVMLGTAAVAILDASYGNFRPKETLSVLKVKAKHLFKTDLVVGNALPDASTVDYELLDRVVCSSALSVPFGLQGYVIAITNDSKGKPETITVLFDETFPEGLAALGCASPRVANMSPSAIINITATQPRAPKPAADSSSLQRYSRDNFAMDNSARNSYNGFFHKAERPYQNDHKPVHLFTANRSDENKLNKFEEGQKIGLGYAQAHPSAFANVQDPLTPQISTQTWRNPVAMRFRELKIQQSVPMRSGASSRRDFPDSQASTKPSPVGLSRNDFLPSFVKANEETVPKSPGAEKEVDDICSSMGETNLGQARTDKSNYFIMSSYFATSHLGLPKFTIDQINQGFVAQVTVPTGEVYTSPACSTKSEAIENASAMILNELKISAGDSPKKEQLTESVQNFFSKTGEKKICQSTTKTSSATSAAPTAKTTPVTAKTIATASNPFTTASTSSTTTTASKPGDKNPLFEALMKSRMKDKSGQQDQKLQQMNKENSSQQPMQQQLPLPPAQWQSPVNPMASKKDTNFISSQSFVNSNAVHDVNMPANQRQIKQSPQPANAQPVGHSITEFFDRYPHYQNVNRNISNQFPPFNTAQNLPNQQYPPVSDTVRQFMNQYPQYYTMDPKQKPKIQPFVPYIPPAARNFPMFSPYSQLMGQQSFAPPIQRRDILPQQQQPRSQNNTGQPQPLMEQVLKPPTESSSRSKQDNKNPFVPLQAITGTKVTRGVSVPQPKQPLIKADPPAIPEPTASSSSGPTNSEKKAKKPPRRRIAANLNFPTD